MDKHNFAKQISILIMCAILGFAMSIQFNSVKSRPKEDSANARTEDLQKMLAAEKEKTTALQEQIKQMQTTIDNYRESIEQTGSAYKGMEEDLMRAENLAGLTNVYGPGVTVTLEDAKITGNVTSPETFIIHDSDVRAVVNELLAAGAEAVTVNDERIISTTAIRCVGPVLLVNNARSGTPFVIKAIGNPDTLENALNMTGGIVSELRSVKINVSIQKEERIDMNAYSGVVNFNYLTTVKAKQD